jgi:thioredoxin 1
MPKRAVTVELLFAGGCSKCAQARDALRGEAESLGARWEEIDVAKNPNRAVDLGVVSTPAVAIDGNLVFKNLPGLLELRKAIRARAAKA